MTHSFRFGLVAMPQSAADWRRTAARVENLGFDALLVPDNLDAVAPMLACVAAASATSSLTVGPYVLATPLRTPGLVAAEAAALHLLSGGRVEVGLGAGRPDSRAEAERLGLHFGTPGDRVTHLEATISAVRERVPAASVTVAASGPRMLSFAGRHADTVALGASPYAGQDELARMARAVLDAAADRADTIVLNQNLAVVGDTVPPWLEQRMGLSLERLVSASSASLLRGAPREMADILLRRREATGISYFCAGVHHAEQLAPVVELLRSA